MRALPDSLFALFFPTLCRICQQPIEVFTTVPVCGDCLQSGHPFTGLECDKCGLFLQAPALLHGTLNCGLCRRGAFVFEQARSFGWYDGTLRLLIQCLKYDGFRPLAKPLGRHLANSAGRLREKSFDLILPVPLHRKRQHMRGFNQAALLGARLSKILGIPMGDDCVRVRDTPPQTGLRAAERRKNVAGAFHVPSPERVKSRRMLLVDDVLTTGATVNSCAQSLLEAGAEAVGVVTLARVYPRHGDVL